MSNVRTRPQPFGEIWRGLTDGLRGKDSRYQYFYNYRPIDKLMKPAGFFHSPKQTKVIFGGNKSTKSTAAAFESVMIYTGIIPPAMRGVYPHKIPTHRARHVKIIVMDYTKHWPETIRPLLLGDPEQGEEGMLPEAWSMWDEKTHIFTGPDGSTLSIHAVDPSENVDPRTLRGPPLDHTWIDEINRESVYTESVTRGAAMKDRAPTLTLSYCPQEGYECWTYTTFYLPTHDRLTKQPLPEDQQPPDLFAVKVSMKDNPSITPEQRAAIVSRLKPWEIAFRVDGEYSQRAANPYFDMETLLRWEQEGRCDEGISVVIVEREVDSEKGIFVGDLVKATPSVDEKYEPVWHVWELPTHGQRYILPADCAEGNPDSDKNSASVWNVTTPGKEYQAAHLNMRLLKPGAFAVQCCMMGNIYGKCLIANEVNNTAGGIFVDRARNYGNLYTRITADKLNEKQTKKVGWFTGPASKGPMLDELYKLLSLWQATIDPQTQMDFCGIRSRTTLLELIAFEERIEKQKNGLTRVIWGARAGANDDCVMEMGIGMRVARHERYKLSTCIMKTDMLDGLQSSREFEQRRRNGHAAFTNLKPQPSLDQLRQRAIGKPWHRTSMNTLVRARMAGRR